MLPYDSRKNYFGAENTRLAEVFGNILSNMPDLRDDWNYAAYSHDVGYEGIKKTGFFGCIKNILHRRKVDKKFRGDLESAVIFAENATLLTPFQADRAMDLAKISYSAVRCFGWKFYKVRGK